MRTRFLDLSLAVRVTVMVLLVILVFAAAIGYFLVELNRRDYLADRSASLHNRLQLKSAQLGLDIESLRRNTLVLSRMPPVQGIIRALRNGGFDAREGVKLAFWEKRLPEQFALFVETNPQYFKVRFIGVADGGRELVRVDLQNGRVVVTPPDELQRKGDRDFIQATAKLKSGEIYLSQINLNQDQGKIQTPHIRTLRAATPIFAPDGELFGMVIINLDIGSWIDRATSDLPPGVQAYVMNAAGDYLAHPEPGRTFGFDLGRRHTWQEDMPGLQPALPSPAGQRSLRAVPTSVDTLHVAAEQVQLDPAAKDHFVVLAYALPDTVVEARVAGGRGTILIITATLALLIGGGMFVFLRRTFSPLARLTESAESIGAGHYDVTLSDESMGEIGSVVRAFRRMLDGIRARERKLQHSEEQLRATLTRAEHAQERAEALLEAAPDPVVIVDHTGRIAVLNAQAETVFGYPRAELLGQPVEILIPEHLHAAHVAKRTAYQEDTQPAQRMGAGRELLARRKDGSEFAVDVSLSPLATPEGTLVISTVRDVTERKQAERRIREQLEHLNLLDRITRSIGERLDLASVFQVVVRTLEDSLPVDFCCIGLHDPTADALRIESVGVKSEALAMELALARHAAIQIDHNGLGRCMGGQLVYEPDIGTARFPFPEQLARAGLRSLVLAPLRSESRVFGVLVAARREAEAFSSVECEFLRQLSEHIALASAQAQLHGALQQAYDDLRQTQQVVMQEERLRALGQMASGIAHDINNALSPVSLYTDSLLETEPNLSERARGYLETIQRAVEDVALTVARMREFYRKREEQLELAPVDVNLLVQQVLDLTRARWSDMPLQHGISIQALPELAAGLPKIMGVESEIREALTNLVFNAVDAMPDGGRLTLRTRLAAAAGDADHASVVIEVADDGVGMDEDTRQRCLEPFFTTKGERGTGLGLAMVFGTVQRHSAELEIESAPGAGTTMRLVFAVPVAIEATPGQVAGAPAVPSRLRLLLIDDDPVLLKSLCDALKTDGHMIVTANGGENGIAVFHSSLDQGERFAAVITDLGMPYVDGRKVAAAVKAASPATPVIMLTGWGQRLIAEGDIPPHVDRVLAKPPKLRELREALGHLCLGARS